VGGAGEWAGGGAQFSNYCGTDFAGLAGLVEVSQEEAAEAAGRDFSGEIGVIDLAADAASEVVRSGLELMLVGANGGLRSFFAGRAG
jgi:hypothetical protein